MTGLSKQRRAAKEKNIGREQQQGERGRPRHLLGVLLGLVHFSYPVFLETKNRNEK